MLASRLIPVSQAQVLHRAWDAVASITSTIPMCMFHPINKFRQMQERLDDAVAVAKRISDVLEAFRCCVPS